MSSQHHFFVFLSFSFFHWYQWCHPHCLLNINRCLSRRERRTETLWLRFFLSLCLSIYCHQHVTTFTGLFGHLYLCFFPLLFSVPPFSGGRLRNDQSVFDAAGPCFGFPKHMSPGNYKKAPSRQLLLCNTRVWSRRKRRRIKRRKTKRRRRKRWKSMNNVLLDICHCSSEDLFHREGPWIFKYSYEIILSGLQHSYWLLSHSTTLPRLSEERIIYTVNVRMLLHTCGRQEVLGYGREGVRERWWSLYPQQSLDKTQEEVRNHRPI